MRGSGSACSAIGVNENDELVQTGTGMVDTLEEMLPPSSFLLWREDVILDLPVCVSMCVWQCTIREWISL